MRRVIRRVGGVSLPRRRPRFESLVRSIIAQQLSVKAAYTIHERVRKLCGGRVTAERLARLDDGVLRAAGVSKNKLLGVRDLGARCIDGSLRLDRLSRLADDAVIAELTQVRGIGHWSAEMFLIFVLTRPDVLPVGDLGIQKGFTAAYGLDELPCADDMHARAEAWRPYRTVGAWYLWRYLET